VAALGGAAGGGMVVVVAAFKDRIGWMLPPLERRGIGAEAGGGRRRGTGSRDTTSWGGEALTSPCVCVSQLIVNVVEVWDGIDSWFGYKK
jgi:hypothetical protein